MAGSKLKILMTTDTLGGVWNYSVSLCKTLTKSYNVEIHLASMGALPSPAQKATLSGIHNIKFYPADYKLEWMQHPWQDVEKARNWFLELYHKLSPDLVHLNNYMQLNITAVPVITVFHSCVLTWWKSVKGVHAPKEWELYARHVQKSLENSTMVVSPTRALLKEAEAYYQINASKIIPNACEEINARGEKEEFILCAGRIWDEAKNLKVLSEIAEDLPWPVYIAGPGEHPDSGKKTEIKNVHFLGDLNREELLKWMARAAIFLSPVKYEPFGLAVLEAAKSGCALAISRLETLQETWKETAAYFDPDNPDHIKEALLEFINDETYRTRQASFSKKRSEVFSLAPFSQAYMQLYRNVLKNQPTIKTY